MAKQKSGDNAVLRYKKSKHTRSEHTKPKNKKRKPYRGQGKV